MKPLMVSLLFAVFPGLCMANDYPTLERVDHVLTCMKENGGQTVDNLYACACEVDIIAQRIAFEDFTEARTFEIYKRMPGEKGSLFRDSERAEDLTDKLVAARAEAKKRCFIGMKRPASATVPPPPVTPAGAPQAVVPAAKDAP